MSSLSIRVQYKYFKTICKHNLDNYPIVPSSSFLMFWSVKHVVETLYNYSVFFIRQLTKYFHALFRMTFDIVWPRDSFCVRFLSSRQFFSFSRRNSWFEHLSVLVNNSFVRLALTLSTSPIQLIKIWGWFSKTFHEFSPILLSQSLHSRLCSCAKKSGVFSSVSLTLFLKFQLWMSLVIKHVEIEESRYSYPLRGHNIVHWFCHLWYSNTGRGKNNSVNVALDSSVESSSNTSTQPCNVTFFPDNSQTVFHPVVCFWNETWFLIIHLKIEQRKNN